jgi:DNA-binding FadR family transcriptional regulator
LEGVKWVLKPETEFSRTVFGSHERIYDALRYRDSDNASREMLKDVSVVAEGLTSLSKKRKDYNA